MKAFYIPVTLLAVILGFSLWTGQYVEQRTGRLASLLEETETLVQQEDWTQAEKRLEDAYVDWNTSQAFFHTIMDHSELDEAEELFAGAIAACREADGADCRIFLAQLNVQLRLLAETQCLSVRNVL